MYETEEQQVEALKKWWKENGKSIIAGIVLGLAGVLGWRAWSDHRDNVASQASNIFDQMVVSVDMGDAESAAKQAQTLHQEYGSTPYSGFAELMQARLLYEKGDGAAAAAALEQAIAKAPDEALKTIAVLRLARLRVAADELDAAEALLQKHPAPATFNGEYAAVRGDIALGRGDTAAARSAYQQALAEQAGNADLVQLKLENLPPAS
jgi:predicted negative regulator of RcsB-dependent stress response